MRTTRLFTHLLPTATLGAVAALALSTTPASANSGWWYSGTSASKGCFTSYGDKTTACDIDTDGYKALVQILSIRDSLLYRVVDNYNDGKCTSRNASYFNLQEGATYQIEVCIVKNGGRPLDCRAHPFTA
ncbi:hypothetical protein ACWEFD_33600 [Streptomyces ardesiacus]